MLIGRRRSFKQRKIASPNREIELLWVQRLEAQILLEPYCNHNHQRNAESKI